MRQRLESELQLSAAQKDKLDAIFNGAREKMGALRGLEKAERQKLMERNRAEIRAQIVQILTPEQASKFEAISAESQGSRGGRTTSGRIYALDGDGQPLELNVRLGLTDGTMTEVISADIKEATDIIVGLAQPQGGAVRAGSAPRGGGPRMF